MNRRLSISHVRAGYYLLTAANTVASQYYLNFLFFLFRDRFGFGSRENLLVSALYGFIYIFSAWQCGKFAERRGYGTSIQLGFGSLALCMIVSGLLDALAIGGAMGHLVVLAAYSVVLLLTWPALEAVTTAHAPASQVPRLVGIYNVTWSSAAAVAYFTGGALYEWFGSVTVFWIPAVLFTAQFLAARWLAGHERRVVAELPRARVEEVHHPEAAAFVQSVPPKTFLSLAWIASPFSYVAIYTVLPIIPTLAMRLGLSATQSGVFCSVWMFARLIAFAGLWHWTGWHYRFRWLVASNVLLIVSFAAILLAPSLRALVAAQIAFGLAIGLIYYSSLFYSMDVGDAKAEHGGIHEAVIGLGSFAGPAVGAVALRLVPNQANAGVAAVSGLLTIGLAVLVVTWRHAKTSRPSDH
jgi:MFS family permease